MSDVDTAGSVSARSLAADADAQRTRSDSSITGNRLNYRDKSSGFGRMRQDGSMQMAATQKEGSDQNFDYMFKVLIIGNSSVGKTSFLFRYADDSFTSAFVSTVGIDFKVKTVYKNDKRIKLQIWDTAGQERYRTITTAYYRGAMGFILMYDITNEESFGAVQDWSTQIKTYSWDNAQVILAGNKCDMEEERVVSTDNGRLLAEQLGKFPLPNFIPKTEFDSSRETIRDFWTCGASQVGLTLHDLILN
uniref:small monomeric GTPase n=1 Tax=Cyprinus carpio TaxID=7962 RepID=A0A8C1Y9D2_CYPCA